MFTRNDIVADQPKQKNNQPPVIGRQNGFHPFVNKFGIQILDHVAFQKEVDKIKYEHETNTLSKERSML